MRGLANARITAVPHSLNTSILWHCASCTNQTQASAPLSLLCSPEYVDCLLILSFASDFEVFARQESFLRIARASNHVHIQITSLPTSALLVIFAKCRYPTRMSMQAVRSTELAPAELARLQPERLAYTQDEAFT